MHLLQHFSNPEAWWYTTFFNIQLVNDHLMQISFPKFSSSRKTRFWLPRRKPIAILRQYNELRTPSILIKIRWNFFKTSANSESHVHQITCFFSIIYLFFNLRSEEKDQTYLRSNYNPFNCRSFFLPIEKQTILHFIIWTIVELAYTVMHKFLNKQNIQSVFILCFCTKV